MKTRRTRYVHLYDPVQLQTWLEDQARRGWLLEDAGGGNTYGVSPCFAHFVRGEGGAVRCRLVPMRTEGGGILVSNIPEPGRDMLELYEGLGWKYVCNLRGYYVFSAETPAAPEPFTDADTACEALESVVRMTRRCLYSYLVSCALYACSVVMTIGRRGLWWVECADLLCDLLVALLFFRRNRAARQRLELARLGKLENQGAYRDTWYLRWGDALLNLAPWLVILTTFVTAWAMLIN